MNNTVRWIPPLPKDWDARFDQEQRRYFFINHVTKLTQWEDPRFQQPQQPHQHHPQKPQPTAAAAARALGSHDSSASTPSRQAGVSIRLQESAASSHNSHHHSHHHQQEESSESEEADQAIVAKLHKEFPKASKALIVDMLLSCYNNESETRVQLKDFGFGKDGSPTARHKTVANKHASTQPQPHHGHGTARETTKELTQAEKDQMEGQLFAQFPALPRRVIQVTMDVVKYDLRKAKVLLQNYKIVTPKTETNERSTSGASGGGASSTATSLSPANLQPAAMTESSSLLPQGFDSDFAATGSDTRPKTTTISSQLQQVNKAKKFTKKNMNEYSLNTAMDILDHLTSRITPCCPKSNNRNDEQSRTPATTPKREPVVSQPRHTERAPQSSLLSQTSNALGPDLSLCRGPDPSLLSNDVCQASGPDTSLCHGPDRNLCFGPDSTRVRGPIGACGPDSSMQCGPQSSLVSTPEVLITAI